MGLFACPAPNVPEFTLAPAVDLDQDGSLHVDRCITFSRRSSENVKISVDEADPTSPDLVNGLTILKLSNNISAEPLQTLSVTGPPSTEDVGERPVQEQHGTFKLDPLSANPRIHTSGEFESQPSSCTNSKPLAQQNWELIKNDLG